MADLLIGISIFVVKGIGSYLLKPPPLSYPGIINRIIILSYFMQITGLDVYKRQAIDTVSSAGSDTATFSLS